MAWSDGLDGVHREIAESPHPRIGVLAGPGTGKTRYGLLRRVARLLEVDHVAPEQILLLSFTRTAAQDLVNKLAELHSPGAKMVRATTIHAFCFSVLQKDAVLGATGRKPRTLLEHETDFMLRDLEGDFGDIYARRELLHAFEAGWAREQSQHPGLALTDEDRTFEAQVIRWLRHHEAMLIGEVVPIAYDYLKNSPLAPERTQFRHLIVDEYQDLNRLEQEVVNFLRGPDASICAAGDDDQSIYRFRHAHPQGIRDFVDDPATESKTILACGRCPQLTVDIANSLMHSAPNRDKEDLTFTSQRASQVRSCFWRPRLMESFRRSTMTTLRKDKNLIGRNPVDCSMLR
ncbi:MAG: UvrD-helicase domain-containing protein [Chloroflexota bacterium]